MANIILQKIVQNYIINNNEWFLPQIDQFGIDWKLFDYQKEAIENILKTLYLFYNKGVDELYEYYKKEGLTKELEDRLSVKIKDENFKILSNYYEVKNNKIDFKNFLNRASFWMATGSGKTIVMIKLVETLHYLMKKDFIPKKDILILAPKDEILNQIKNHIEVYNKNNTTYIDFRNLKEWEKLKNERSLFDESSITIFYYRADNIKDENKDKLIDYKSFYNNGNWYLILDEAHKGEKSTSKRQQYFTILSKNGFLFNFSATFTDDMDIVTTVFDFKLDTFLNKGYGKKIYVANSEFKDFKPKKKNKNVENDFSFEEKKDIISQTLILLAFIRKNYKKIKNVNSNLYHSPLLITLANSVNIKDADLKIFFQLLAEIAKGKFDFKENKNKLIQTLESERNYLFDLDEIDENIIDGIEKLTEAEFFENVFNSKELGNIEVIKIKNNSKEIAFKLKNSDEIFMLIVASDIIKWENDILEGYEFGESVEDSLFSDINKRDNISILLGSRIFTEGWDSNRPNIINFINIGVNEEAKKFVLQSIGRGIRIEPIKNFRKRFDYIDKSLFDVNDIQKIRKYNKALESLFIFATNKEVISNILNELEKQSFKWLKVKGIKKNEKINEKDIPLLVPEFENGGLNEKPFKISEDSFKKLQSFIDSVDEKVLILKENIKVRTLKKLKDKNNFNILGSDNYQQIEVLLKHIDNFFNKPIKKLKELKILENHITHYQEIRTNLSKEDLEVLEKEILQVLNKNDLTIEKVDELFDEEKISREEYKKLLKELSFNSDFKILNKEVNYKIFKEHYYVPILLKKETNNFQHIIKVPSEIEFLKELRNYLKGDNELKNYDWWYFSKIDESIDKVKIPYFDKQKGDYSNFSPDFIFWLKKDNSYYIKFIDPKGVEHTTNAIYKIEGFEEFKSNINDKKIKEGDLKIKVDLYYFNKKGPEYIEEKYKKYWTNDLNEIFKIKEK